MIIHQTELRVRYAETDKMGYAYYGNYAAYFEVARVELLRSLGISYKEMEDDGVMLPVFDYQVRYFKPAYYDELLRIETTIAKMPGSRIIFDYCTYNEKGEQLNKASTTLVFVGADTGRPIRLPDTIHALFAPYFNEQT